MSFESPKFENPTPSSEENEDERLDVEEAEVAADAEKKYRDPLSESKGSTPELKEIIEERAEEASEEALEEYRKEKKTEGKEWQEAFTGTPTPSEFKRPNMSKNEDFKEFVKSGTKESVKKTIEWLVDDLDSIEISMGRHGMEDKKIIGGVLDESRERMEAFMSDFGELGSDIKNAYESKDYKKVLDSGSYPEALGILRSKLESILNSKGVSTLEKQGGQEFNSLAHAAFATEKGYDSKNKETYVTKESRRAFVFNGDVVIRPAKVMVGNVPPKKETDAGAQENKKEGGAEMTDKKIEKKKVENDPFYKFLREQGFEGDPNIKYSIDVKALKSKEMILPGKREFSNYQDMQEWVKKHPDVILNKNKDLDMFSFKIDYDQSVYDWSGNLSPEKSEAFNEAFDDLSEYSDLKNFIPETSNKESGIGMTDEEIEKAKKRIEKMNIK